MTMRLDISYEAAKERHPEQVAEVIETLRKSKSKQKGSAPEDLKWYYNYCKQVQAVSLMDVLAGAQERAQQPQTNPTVEERIATMIDGLHFSVEGTKGHWSGRAQLNDGFIPPELMAEYVEAAEREHAEKERFAALPEAEQNAEVEGLLSQLRGPGFMEFRM